ncbi:MAG TPA: hypothetical protein ENF81_04955 [Thermotogaceae bacterium]|nr:hypothetical protein [Thermotogaceae bacterium]
MLEQTIISLLERNFQSIVKNVNFENEKHFKKELIMFLELNLPANITIKSEVRTKFGVVDILVDGNYILELKYADNKNTLDRGISEVIRYKKFRRTVIVVLLDVRVLDRNIITRYRDYYKEVGAEVIIIRAKGQRKRGKSITSHIRNLMIDRKLITIEEMLRNHKSERKSLYVALSRLQKKGRVERIEKGKYMIIPLGAEKGKYTLNEFVIGSLLVKPYTIAYWSALHYYGLTEQIPNTVFIQTTTRKKNQIIEIFGVRYKIVKIKETKFFGIKKTWIEETQINITDKEKTIVDCLDKPQYCGGIVEVAKALKNGNFDKNKLITYVKEFGNSGVIRRLGYLCDLLQIDISLPRIDTRSYLFLDPTMPHKGSKSAKWRLIVNLDEKVLGELE